MGSRQPSRTPALLIGAALIAAVVAVATTSTTPAGAEELSAFGSCEALREWTAQPAGGAVPAQEDMATTAGAVAPMSEEASADRAAAPTAGSDDSGGDSTNVIVEGVDEFDRVERRSDTRHLVVGSQHLSLVDTATGENLAQLEVPFDAQVSVDAQGTVWVVGTTDTGFTQVLRTALEGDAFTPIETWETAGQLVAARRTDAGVHLVVSDGFMGPMAIDGPPLPFGGRVVPCDQVLHPTGVAEPAATLIVNLPATGELTPSAATEIVGSGRFVHVTPSAVFLATPLWEEQATTLHRFDLESLEHTGSGRTDGTLLNEFAMSADGDHLRVAVTHGGGRIGMAIEDSAGDMTADVAIERALPTQETSTSTEAPPQQPTTSVPDEPAATTTTETPDTAVPVPLEPPPTTDAPPPTDEPVPLPEPIDPPSDPESALNEIVVFDTGGDLDEVGRTARFGHPGETIHGIRFVGPVAYAVTFLTTDPFYVVDLSDPTHPAVVGEVQLPGFSSYLHPVADGFVAGFGPDGQGALSIKLFDVSHPTAPVVADALSFGPGTESEIAWDHHAFLDLGDGSFAIPVSAYRFLPPEPCPNGSVEDRARQAAALSVQVEDEELRDEERDALFTQLDQLWSDPCMEGTSTTDTSVAVVSVAGGRLTLDVPATVTAAEPGSRVLDVGSGWGLLTQSDLLVVDEAGTLVHTIDLHAPQAFVR